MADEPLDKAEIKSEGRALYLTDRVIVGGMIAVNIIILQILTSFQNLDDHLRTAAITVSIALPLLISSFLLHDLSLLFLRQFNKDVQYKGVKIVPFVLALIDGTIGLVGIVVTLVGLAHVLFHIFPDAGQAFITTIIIVSLLVLSLIILIAISAFFQRFL
jgi:hypothetical protein